jgi:hypothetical protein
MPARNLGQITGEADEMKLSHQPYVSHSLPSKVPEEARKNETGSLGERTGDALRLELFEISGKESLESDSFTARAGEHDGSPP